jgi:hypothetical protein
VYEMRIANDQLNLSLWSFLVYLGGEYAISVYYALWYYLTFNNIAIGHCFVSCWT